MPPKVPPTPYNLVVPLRRDNEAPQCPEVKRCLLSVEREPLPDLLEVVDSGLPSQALNRETTVQVVRAQLIPSGHSCRKDYTVKAGLIGNSGLIACGQGKNRTTTVRTLVIYIPSGSVISDGTNTTVDIVAASTPGGETVSEEMIDNGDQTQTTITTTILVERDEWDVALQGCRDVTEMFPGTPSALAVVKYRIRGEDVVLYNYRYTLGGEDGVEQTTYLAVSVSRAGKLYTISHSGPTPTMGGVLSADLGTLYIATSTTDTGITTVSWSRHVWDKYAAAWVAAASGCLVPADYDAIIGVPTVDSSGLLHGPARIAESISNIVEYEDLVCKRLTYPIVGVATTDMDRGTERTALWTPFSIEARQYVSGGYYPNGLAIIRGDVHPVRGMAYRSDTKRIYNGWVEYNVDSGTHIITAHDSNTSTTGHVHVSCTADGVGVGKVRAGYSMSYVLSGSWDNSGDQYNISVALESFEEFNGAYSLQTHGGWVLQRGTYMDGEIHGDTTISASGTGHWAYPGRCPPQGNLIYPFLRDLVRTERDVMSSTWPEHIDLADGFKNAFCAVDNSTGNSWYGILVGDADWQVWHNGAHAEAELKGCLCRQLPGASLAEIGFSGLYWTS